MYIDIHTHINKQQKNVIAVRNYIVNQDVIQTQHLFSYGLHPWHLSNVNDDFENDLLKLVDKPGFIAVGECGMDFQTKILDKYPVNFQKEIFIKQLFWAEKYQKPVIIHCVRCFDKLMQINKQIKPRKAWIIHAFSKQKQLALQLIQAGFYLSFGAQLFKSEKNRNALQVVPLNRLFLETDAQETYDIIQIYEKVAAIKGISVSLLKKEIRLNFKKVFGNKILEI
jgi:TatD DNase family protein